MARRRREFSFSLCFVLSLSFIFVFSAGFFFTINLCEKYEREFPASISGVCAWFERWSAFDIMATESLLSPRSDSFSGLTRRSLFQLHHLHPRISNPHGVSSSRNLRRQRYMLSLAFDYPLIAGGQECFSAVCRRSVSHSSELVFISVSIYLSVPFAEETLASVSRCRRRASLVTDLGQPYGTRLQRLNPSWAWPIICLSWVISGHISLSVLKPTWPIRRFLLACPNLPILLLPQIPTPPDSSGCFFHFRLPSPLTPRRVVFAGDSAQPPFPYLSEFASQLVFWNEFDSNFQSSHMLPDSSPRLFQPSSCRGQERSIFSSSSLLKERTLSHLSLSMRGTLLLISLSKKLIVLTGLSSSVMVYTGLVETTENVYLMCGLHNHCPSSSITLMLLNSVSVGRGQHPISRATSLCWFGRYHFQEGTSHRISSTAGKFLGPLLASYLMSLSRTHDIAFFCAEFIYDFKGLWRQSCSVMEVISAQPSSLVERIVSSLLVFSKWFTLETIEAKESSSTSRILLIVTIVKLPECFAEVSLTHHNLACDMLRYSFRLRVSMDLSPMFNTYAIFLATFVVSLLLFCLMYPAITVVALYSLSSLVE